MASSEDFMPDGNNEFFVWQHNFVKQIIMAYPVTEAVANAVIAGTTALPVGPHPWVITQPEIQALLTSAQGYEPAYQKGADKNNRTPSDTETAAVKKKSHRTVCRNFVNTDLRFNKLITPTIKETLRLTVPKTTRTRHTVKIADIPVVSARGIGGGSGDYTCRTATDQSKPSLPPDPCDSVEVRAALIVQGAAQPQSAAECPIYFDSTKAQFTHNFGQENKGKQVVSFVRYGSSKHSDLDGDWSDAVVFTLA